MLPEEQKRMLILFGYETQGGRNSFLWVHPELATRTGKDARTYYQDEFEAWVATKRPFAEEEVTTGKWIKFSDHGYGRVVHFKADGTLDECELFPPMHTWGGFWQLINGVLRMNVTLPDEQGSNATYGLDIFGCVESIECSGIEFRDNNSAPNAYFKVIHLV